MGSEALRVDHIGSTSVPGLAAKDLIDVQITVETLEVADTWPDELLPGLRRRAGSLVDHVPETASGEPADWDKRYWSNCRDLHVHERPAGRTSGIRCCFETSCEPTPLPRVRDAALKRSLAAAAPDDWDTYYEVKDPACDLILAGAEHWAAEVGWVIPPSDG